MAVRMEPSWALLLASEFAKPYFQRLSDAIRQSYLTETVYPLPAHVFRAFDLCPLDRVKVVILGQDPYHGKGQAHGLSFSVEKGMRIPPSLQNILKELKSDLGIDSPPHGDLSEWAEQGVLLLNATLTVEAGKPGSHQGKGWEEFTDAVIRTLADTRKHLVFILWGKYAQQKEVLIDTAKHLVLKSAHPSPYSASAGFFGSKPFSKTNAYLEERGIEPIRWGREYKNEA